jgi:hypothetical protein
MTYRVSRLIEARALCASFASRWPGSGRPNALCRDRVIPRPFASKIYISTRNTSVSRNRNKASHISYLTFSTRNKNRSICLRLRRSAEHSCRGGARHIAHPSRIQLFNLIDPGATRLSLTTQSAKLPASLPSGHCYSRARRPSSFLWVAAPAPARPGFREGKPSPVQPIPSIPVYRDLEVVFC